MFYKAKVGNMYVAYVLKSLSQSIELYENEEKAKLLNKEEMEYVRKQFPMAQIKEVLTTEGGWR